MPVADLHCDLLWYLANDERRTIYNSDSQASLSQLLEGGVKLQTFPIYTQTTPDSVEKGTKQWEIYKTHRSPR